MQERHKNRYLYFQELSRTSKLYFIPYIERWHPVGSGMNVLEIGCGDGGNLLPFSRKGCRTVGVDMAKCRIDDARTFFAEAQADGEFIASDIFKLKEFEYSFDIIICHDVLEHIGDKLQFLSKLSRYIKADGIVFMSFPAWQMPFGGHQQICQSKVVSHLPFIHLLPTSVYRLMLKLAGEKEGCINELLSIKQTRTPIELFEKTLAQTDLKIVNRQLWLVNPHYETKFGLKPRKLNKVISGLPWIRNFFSTSCFYILKK